MARGITYLILKTKLLAYKLLNPMKGVGPGLSEGSVNTAY
jgi:hypothetical protein